MASFDPEELGKQSTGAGTSNIADHVKYPIKRLELSIRNFIKVLDIDLDRLQKHTENIRKLTSAEDWVGLHKEQVNASRTVQQIKANIREVERARTQVVEEDLGVFDSKVQDVKTKALSSMEGFVILLGSSSTAAVKSPPSPTKDRPMVETGRGSCRVSSSSPQSVDTTFTEERNVMDGERLASTRMPYEEDLVCSEGETYPTSPYGNISLSMTSYAPAPVTSELHIAPQHTDASISWEQLQENIVELNELVHHFADTVEQQGEVINSIEANIETAHADIQQGTTSLAQASKYKSAMLPVFGAVVGGMVGGPIGFVAGMKLGGLAGVVGGAAGFAGGRMLKKRQTRIAQIELENLTDKRSVSVSDDAVDPETDRKLLLRDSHGEITNCGQSSRGFSGLTELYSGVTSSFKHLFPTSSTPTTETS